ncbi:hypothetical protein Cp29156_02615 [Corynebacterium pseudotuberculosis]|nr:hypothetical protein CP31_03450 [Corynebacterium pseudotuberculosis 31]QGW57448.1 hypothetical protein CPCIP5297_03240 [Corynebacterium pseudotuberculosis CIP 52.97]QGY50075.1 hypothetical protein CPSIGK_10055 [Corynebacterium pseudotuberculosis]QHQ71092.1 hypothetical protein CP1002_10040 [Corynebacterium pseudotuberculosis 1002]QHI75853.1 hypothetical protein CpPAT14_10050 [Corynebacterium pseudotuberculosis]
MLGSIGEMQAAAKLGHMIQVRLLGVFKPHEVNFDATGNSFNYSNTLGDEGRGVL